MTEDGTRSSRFVEIAAIGQLVGHLRAHGIDVIEVGHPEDDPTSAVNVDSELLIEGERWAAEHTRIVYDHLAVAAEEAAEGYLRPKLERLAGDFGVALSVAFYAPRWSGKQLPTKYWDGVFELAERAARTVSFVGDERGNSVFAATGNPCVSFVFFASENSAVGDQYKNALTSPLSAKLSGQLRVAKENGFKVLLLLDQVPAPENDPGTMWTPDEGTLDMFMSSLLAEYPGVVDEVWLREASGNLRQLIPS